MLVPLSQARSFLPASGLAGDGAPLVPRAVFDRGHPLTVTDEPDALYAALSTVALRLDACFKEGTGAQTCRPQVRLVLQPVFDSAQGTTTRDAAMHVFFAVKEGELDPLVRDLAQLRTRLGLKVSEGLSAPHPGFDQAAWRDAARKLLLPLLRGERLVRATSMSVHASNQAWIFSGVEVAGTSFTDIVIPTLSPAVEQHVTSTGGKDALRITLDPAPSVEPKLPAILNVDVRKQAPPEAVTTALESLARIEDPSAHNPGTLDCASCHVAASARWFLTHDSPPLTIESPAPLSDVYADSRVIRAFGYFLGTPAISPRVARETAFTRIDFSKRMER